MVVPVALAAVLALSSSGNAAPHEKGVGHWWAPVDANATVNAPAAQLEVIWLEDQMCFCNVPRLPVVQDTYRTPFGAARRVHSDFRGRTVDSVEGGEL